MSSAIHPSPAAPITALDAAFPVLAAAQIARHRVRVATGGEVIELVSFVHQGLRE
jgi:hypothetical protein